MRIVRLTDRYFSDASQMISQAWNYPLSEARNELRTVLLNGSGFIALSGHRPIGVCVYIKAYSHDAHYLNFITVDPAFRRQGVARQLLKSYINACRKETPKKQPMALSSTDIKNTISIKMHKSFGFKPIGTLDRLHYGRKEIFFGFDL